MILKLHLSAIVVGRYIYAGELEIYSETISIFSFVEVCSLPCEKGQKQFDACGMRRQEKN